MYELSQKIVKTFSSFPFQVCSFSITIYSFIAFIYPNLSPTYQVWRPVLVLHWTLDLSRPSWAAASL